MSYIFLFFVALMAATILPISSEALLIYYLHDEKSAILLLISAGLGNTLGSIINYYIGKKGSEYLIKNEKISIARLQKSEELFGRYGAYALLLSWVPIIGDPLTLVAGVLHYDIKKFIIVVSIAKFGRYALILSFAPIANSIA
ncbi:probable membrane protein YPO3302 [hydrothermal vent metagenome]|uniref:Probable membrane protein YPO3302 n=1 Tax=hydrothermal vent metagenome TaxID=652676 RepID=A0A1W1BKI6_9ZZZZ